MNEPKHKDVGLRDKNGESVDFFQKKLKFSFPPALWSLARSKKSQKNIWQQKTNEHTILFCLPNIISLAFSLVYWANWERPLIECKASIVFLFIQASRVLLSQQKQF